MNPIGRPIGSLSRAILAGCTHRPWQARGDYLDSAGGASVLMTAAEALAKADVDPRYPAATLARLNRFAPLLSLMTVCPACTCPALVEEVVELHLNDRHGWSREKIAAWVRGQEKHFAVDGSTAEVKASVRRERAEERKKRMRGGAKS